MLADANQTRRRWLFRSAAAACTLGALAAPARAAQFEFKCASNLPATHPSSVRLVQMWTAIEQETGGRVRTQFFPNSMLGSDPAMFSQARLGALQFFFISPGILATVVPIADISFMGFAFRDVDEGLRVMAGPLGDYVRDESAKKGIYLLRTFWDSGMAQVCSSLRPIRTPDDFRGFRMGTNQSKISVDMFKALGASATPLSVNEIYTSLQTKIVDGEAAPLVTIESAKWFEVQKYISLTNHAWSSHSVIANGDLWKSLPPDVREIIERNNTKYALLEAGDTKAANAAMTEKLKSQGLILNDTDVTAFRARLRPYYAAWAETFGHAPWSLLENAVGHRLA